MSADKPKLHAAIRCRIVGSVGIVLVIIGKFLFFFQSLSTDAQTPSTNPTHTTNPSGFGLSGLSGLSLVGWLPIPSIRKD